jgi:RNA-directed DNA polymerase
MRYADPTLAIAASILAGEPSAEGISSRLARTFGKPHRWHRSLASRYLKAFSANTRPSRRNVLDFLKNDGNLRANRAEHRDQFIVVDWINEPFRMSPVPAAVGWDVPAIESVTALATWLRVDINDLFWLADLKGLGAKLGRPLLAHYHYRPVNKSTGGVRLLEIPKPRLKALQRRILAGILERIPPHPAVHGFVKSRSIKTHAAHHVGQRVVLRMDLQDFFPSFPAARIAALFRIAGYPESVADLLAGLCTNSVPRKLLAQITSSMTYDNLREARDIYERPHLPQGAPTSPLLANLCAYRMDCRLSGLANSVGANYTRYADDLAFSGDSACARSAERFSIHVAAILMEEGFRVNHRKTRTMRQGVRQYLAGVVANARINVPRPDFDRLKAILTNCVRKGPDAENRDAHPQFRSHLDGRVSFVESIHEERGAKLRAVFERIDWPSHPAQDSGEHR